MSNQLKSVCNIIMFLSLQLVKGKEKIITLNHPRSHQPSTIIHLYRTFARTSTRRSSTSLVKRMLRSIISTVCIQVQRKPLKWIKLQWLEEVQLEDKVLWKNQIINWVKVQQMNSSKHLKLITRDAIVLELCDLSSLMTVPILFL